MIKKLLIGLLSVAILLTSMASFAAEVSADLEDRVQRLERMADNPVLLRLSQQISRQQREIASLHDDVDRLKHQLERSRQDSVKKYRDLNERLNLLERPLVAQSEPHTALTTILDEARNEEPIIEEEQFKPSEKLDVEGSVMVSKPEAVVATVIEIQPVTDEERKIYSQAFDLMKQKQYQEAVVAFKAFKETYPHSSLASNSAYWAGEALLLLGEQDKALESFSWVQQHQPASMKAPDALLRQADTLRNMNKLEQAKLLYQQLIDMYPKDRAATKAISRLEGL